MARTVEEIKEDLTAAERHIAELAREYELALGCSRVATLLPGWEEALLDLAKRATGANLAKNWRSHVTLKWETTDGDAQMFDISSYQIANIDEDEDDEEYEDDESDEDEGDDE